MRFPVPARFLNANVPLAWGLGLRWFSKRRGDARARRSRPTGSVARGTAPARSVNAIARIQIKTASEVLVDDYRRNKTTGSFLLIDPSTHQTVAAGVIDDLNTQA